MELTKEESFFLLKNNLLSVPNILVVHGSKVLSKSFLIFCYFKKKLRLSKYNLEIKTSDQTRHELANHIKLNVYINVS